jgi:hypothetical protein
MNATCPKTSLATNSVCDPRCAPTPMQKSLGLASGKVT